MSDVDIEQYALDFIQCPYCGALAGEWCVVRTTGDYSTVIHSARIRPFDATWMDGFMAGSAR